MRKPIVIILCISLLLAALSGCTEKKAPSTAETDKVSSAQPLSPNQVNPALSGETDRAAGQQDVAPGAVASPQEQRKPDPPEPVIELEADPAGATTPKQYSLKAGDYFPEFNLPDLTGAQFNSATTFAANKVTLVNFWGTFCGPCIREMPALEQLRQSYAGKGLGMIGIVLDSNKVEEAKLMAGKLGTGYPHLLDDGRYRPYIYAVPQTLLVDSEGKILSSVVGARSLQQFISMVEPHLK